MKLSAQFGASLKARSAGISYVFGGSLSPAITFTRASAGTYFDNAGGMQSAGSNAARFDHNPATLSARGLLIEPAGTNLFTRSAEFNDAAWALNNATITANAGAAPDGTTTADKLVGSGAGGPSIFQTPTLTAAAWTVTVYAKMVERRWLIVNYQAAGFDNLTSFDLQNGVLGAASGDSTASIETLPGGWYRCRVTRTATAGVRAIVFHHSSTDASVTNGAAGEGVLLWGAQIELGATPTSYVATAASTATRAADVAKFTPPTGVTSIRYGFDDGTTQIAAVSPGVEYTIPTNLSRAWIKSIVSVG